MELALAGRGGHEMSEVMSKRYVFIRVSFYLKKRFVLSSFISFLWYVLYFVSEILLRWQHSNSYWKLRVYWVSKLVIFFSIFFIFFYHFYFYQFGRYIAIMSIIRFDERADKSEKTIKTKNAQIPIMIYWKILERNRNIIQHKITFVLTK